GVVDFVGPPWPEDACNIGKLSHLDVAPVMFDSFCAPLEIHDLHTEGTAGAQAVMLRASGRGLIPAGQTLTSGRGTRRADGDCVKDKALQMSLIGTNSKPIDVTVDWAQKTCDITGELLGFTVEGTHTLSVMGTLHGTLTNQHPTT